MSLSAAGQTGDNTVAEITGCEAIVTVLLDCVLRSVESTNVVERTFSGCSLGVVESAEVIVMTLPKVVVLEAALLSTELMAAGPLKKSQCAKTWSSRNEKLTLMA